MTETTNQCPKHGEVLLCIDVVKAKVEKHEDKFETVFEIIDKLLPSKYFYFSIAGVVGFSLILFGIAMANLEERRLEVKENCVKIEKNKEIYYSIDKRLSNIETTFGIAKTENNKKF